MKNLQRTYNRLQAEMHKLIDEKGILAPETIEKSQQLDLIVVKMQKVKSKIN